MSALRRIYERCRSDRWFLAAALAAHQARHQLDDVALARQLGTTADRLPEIGLCRMPTDRRDCDVIGRRFELRAGLVAEVCGL